MVEENILRYGDSKAFSPPEKPQKQAEKAILALPDWVRAPLAVTTQKPRLVNPSQVAATNEKVMPASMQQALYRRGQLLHRLLQMLPLAKPEERETLARDFLRHHQPQKSLEDIAKETAEVMAVIGHPDFAAVFAQGSRAEISVIGRVEGKRISGQIDRLVVTDKEVLIVDYKTNRPPPENVQDVPDMYLAQMAAYRALLEKIYPAHTVRCALLWTHTLRLMELPEAFYERGRMILQRP
jgi:ATP-dependent helicase/nuclease subunit A